MATPRAGSPRLQTVRQRVAVWGPQYAWPLAALAASLVVVAPLVAAAGADPFSGYEAMLEASFGSPAGFGLLLQISVPLILVGIGVALPLRAGLFNIGGEGQLLVGALAAVFVGTQFDGIADAPGSFVIPLVAALIAGASLGAIAGAAKAWRGINEIITTIMLNFVALLFVQYWVTGPFKEEGNAFAASPMINEGFALDRLGGQARIPLSFFVALLVVIVVAGLAHYTRAGWRLQLVAVSPRLAERNRVSVPTLQFLALSLGGALAGLGGGAEAIGNQLRVSEQFSPGWGFIAIAVAVLARGNILAVVPYAIFFAFLRNGADALETTLGVPNGIVTMLVGLPVIIFAAVVGFREYRRFVGAAT